MRAGAVVQITEKLSTKTIFKSDTMTIDMHLLRICTIPFNSFERTVPLPIEARRSAQVEPFDVQVHAANHFRETWQRLENRRPGARSANRGWKGLNEVFTQLINHFFYKLTV